MARKGDQYYYLGDDRGVGPERIGCGRWGMRVLKEWEKQGKIT